MTYPAELGFFHSVIVGDAACAVAGRKGMAGTRRRTRIEAVAAVLRFIFKGQ